MDEYSDYIVYVDESGDHGMEAIDKDYPIFVLAFCIFKKVDYSTCVSPAIQRLKFRYFGHDMVVLHEYEIRKARKEFSFLLNKNTRDRFMADIGELIDSTPFTLIAATIRKDLLADKSHTPDNPYHLAMTFGLERLYGFLERQDQHERKTHIVFERRGRREDNELELEFRRVCDGANYPNTTFPFDIVFADKKANSSGLQFADLLARPIGRTVLDPRQANRAYDIIKTKFFKDEYGKVEGWGLKCFP